MAEINKKGLLFFHSTSKLFSVNGGPKRARASQSGVWGGLDPALLLAVRMVADVTETRYVIPSLEFKT